MTYLYLLRVEHLSVERGVESSHFMLGVQSPHLRAFQFHRQLGAGPAPAPHAASRLYSLHTRVGLPRVPMLRHDDDDDDDRRFVKRNAQNASTALRVLVCCKEVKAKFHYASQLASGSLAGRRPACEPARELDSVMEFGLKSSAVI